MAFELFERRYGHGDQVTITTTRNFNITTQLADTLDVGNGSYAYYYFDKDTNRVAIEFTKEKELYYAARCCTYRPKSRSGKPGTLTIAANAFLKCHHIKTQRRIPATIEEVDGKRMIVFPVEVEHGN